MSGEIQVSIICTAYNHERYIRQCLDGFVMQKGVTFEIIIHDDASTDKTADIIREYENEYPDLFKPIYQTENQYSQHINFRKEYMIPLITGKYVALCEGDDFWTDPYKLKKQYDALENNHGCLMCAHKVSVIEEDGNDIGYTCPRNDINASILPVGYICENYDNAKYIHTSSFFFNSSIYKEYILNTPLFRQVAPVGDIPLLLYFTSLANIYYYNEIMSDYRFMSVGSWSYRNQNDPEKEKRRYDIDIKMRAMFIEYNAFTDGKFEKCLADVTKQFSQNVFWYCINHHDYKSLFKEFTKKELKELGIDKKARLKMKLQRWFPKLLK